MKRWKKILLAILALLVFSQAPFVYRRYRLGRLSAAIAALNAERAAAPPDDPYDEHEGVIHVHTLLGGHSTGRPEEVVRAARARGLAFVVMTEHPSAVINSAEATLKGTHDGVLFVNGSEIEALGGERLLVVPGDASSAPAAPPAGAQDLIARAKEGGRLVFVAYPERVRDRRLVGYDGVEVYNLYTDSRSINYGLLFFDGLWSYRGYPELLFSTFYEKPADNLKRWDEINASAGGRAVAVAGNDAHANVGLGLHERTGEEIFGIHLDPYERSFGVVRNHVLLAKNQPLDADSLLAALGRGHSFISFDLFCNARGFRFEAVGGAEKKMMGDEIALPPSGGVRLTARAPVRSRLVFYRDGQVLHEERDATVKELSVERHGVYRVEVYLERLGKGLEGKPWIISNPIYVR